MTPEQFDVCRGRGRGKRTDAARLVLVEGVAATEAASRCEVAMQTLRNALVSIRRRDRQIRAAYAVGA